MNPLTEARHFIYKSTKSIYFSPKPSFEDLRNKSPKALEIEKNYKIEDSSLVCDLSNAMQDVFLTIDNLAFDLKSEGEKKAFLEHTFHSLKVMIEEVKENNNSLQRNQLNYDSESYYYSNIIEYFEGLSDRIQNEYGPYLNDTSEVHFKSKSSDNHIFKINLTVEEIAQLFHLFWDGEIIDFETQTGFEEFICKNFSSKKSNGRISKSSLHNKSYEITDEHRKNVSDVLHRLSLAPFKKG